MINVDLNVSGEEVAVRSIVAALSARLFVPLWPTYQHGRGTVEARVGEWSGDDMTTAQEVLETLASDCRRHGITFTNPDVRADVRLTLAVEADYACPHLEVGPDMLTELAALGLGLLITADVGSGYVTENEDAEESSEGDVRVEDDRSHDIERIVELLATASRSTTGRTKGATFSQVCAAAPVLPLSLRHKREISSRLAQKYMPPFYSSVEAAKSAASQHARVVWALSKGLGDNNASNIMQYLSSL